MECFFEEQASITEDLKRSINERKWMIYVNKRKTAHHVLHEKYFMEKLIDAGFKFSRLEDFLYNLWFFRAIRLRRLLYKEDHMRLNGCR